MKYTERVGRFDLIVVDNTWHIGATIHNWRGEWNRMVCIYPKELDEFVNEVKKAYNLYKLATSSSNPSGCSSFSVNLDYNIVATEKGVYYGLSNEWNHIASNDEQYDRFIEDFKYIPEKAALICGFNAGTECL
jgi:hypothetical protein